MWALQVTEIIKWKIETPKWYPSWRFLAFTPSACYFSPMKNQHEQELIMHLKLQMNASERLLETLVPKSEQHPVDAFLASDQHVIANDGRFAHPRASRIYKEYRAWNNGNGNGNGNGFTVLAARTFHAEMKLRGHERRKKNGCSVYPSLSLTRSIHGGDS